MIKIFTEHPATANETWWQHFKFTWKVCRRTFAVTVLFLIHGLFPFIGVPKKYNLKYTSGWMSNRNVEREDKRK